MTEDRVDKSDEPQASAFTGELQAVLALRVAFLAVAEKPSEGARFDRSLPASDVIAAPPTAAGDYPKRRGMADGEAAQRT